jgi:hypothetical protein
MTRFAWLQSRTQTLVTAALVGVLVVVVAVTGVQLAHLYDSLVAHCASGCDLATSRFLAHQEFLDKTLDLLARLAPAFFGVFWGAPLIARELETGTYRLAWTQSVSRSRWVATKLGLGVLLTAAVAGALTLAVTWWYRDIDKVSTVPFGVFDRRDVVPVAYAVFAFAAGALLGVLIRRTVPAMAATLGLFVLVRVVVATWVRSHLQPPLRETLSLAGSGPSAPVHLGLGLSSNGGPVQLFASADGPKGAWTLSNDLVTSSGHVVSPDEAAAFLHQHCANIGPDIAARAAGNAVAGPDLGRVCLNEVARTYHLLITYQPANRYWTFQWLEAGLFVALAALCAGACYWWVTRRTV